MSASSDDDARSETSNELSLAQQLAAGMAQDADAYIFSRPRAAPFDYQDVIYKVVQHDEDTFVLHEYQAVHGSSGCGPNAQRWVDLEWVTLGTYASLADLLVDYGAPPAQSDDY